ncbi:MAG TPA: DUF4340 domain-containing protein [Deltaproteobacteria bacterium]|nr:DUF4340 domain-containing protein [Deltaproteobacteria bacterium]
MRFFKKTIFWVIILAAIGGSFYIFDRKMEDKKAQEELQRRLFLFRPSDVVSFTIKRRGEDVVKQARRTEDGWVVTAPVEAAGDGEEIEAFLRNLVDARMDAVLFDEAPAEKLEEMGLADPYLVVELRTDSFTRTVRFGDKGPTHNVAFAMIEGDPRVLRIHSDIMTDSDLDLYDLRDKSIVRFEPTRVKSFDVRWRDGTRVFVEHPKEGVWNALELPEGRTDFVKVMELLVQLKKGKVKAFVDEAPEDPAAYGMDDPRVRIVFHDEHGVRHTLEIGARDKVNRGYYARRGGEQAVFSVEEVLYNAIPRKVTDLEVKDDEES